MATVQDSSVFLVGSIPLSDETQVFKTSAEQLGDRVFAIPDGELGPRQMWIGALGAVFAKHPDLELDPETEEPAWYPPSPFSMYRIKAGVETISLVGRLHYADAAIASYAKFAELKVAGSIPADVRFQVALPTPDGPISAFFPNTEEDWPRMKAAYAEAAIAEIKRILEVVPAGELAVQWDFCVELVEIIGARTGERRNQELVVWYPALGADETLDLHTGTAYLGPLTEEIPEEVLLGWHLCLGTQPKQPNIEPADLEDVVKTANALVKNSARRVDFLHLPGMRGSSPEFFVPLEDLDVGDARIILGIECGDGYDNLIERAELARESLPSFAISHFCGYGRDSAETIPELLGQLSKAADELNSK